MRRLLKLPALARDSLLAAVLLTGGMVELATIDPLRGPVWLNVAGLTAVSATVAVRSVWPLASALAWVAAIAAMVAGGAAPQDFSSPFLSVVLLPYAAGSRLGTRPALAALAATWGGIALVWDGDARTNFGDLFFPCMFAAVFFIAGRVVRARSQLTAELHEAAVRAADLREAEAQRAVADERRRIAREMHDVVAHSVSMMVVQAGGARRILEREPERAVAAAALIERTGREALTEMRRLLGVLQPDEHAGYAPQPSLRELDGLIERARGAGMPVALAVDGEQRELPPGLDLAAYRVVQEALTNALKHGGGAATEVAVHYRPDAVEVRISDRGAGAVAGRLDGSGHGLVGMRERVRMYGGDLHAGRRRGGGFEVRARLPFEGEEDAALTSGGRA